MYISITFIWWFFKGCVSDTFIFKYFRVYFLLQKLIKKLHLSTSLSFLVCVRVFLRLRLSYLCIWKCTEVFFFLFHFFYYLNISIFFTNVQGNCLFINFQKSLVILFLLIGWLFFSSLLIITFIEISINLYNFRWTRVNIIFFLFSIVLRE